jgi:hypothetical protein
MNELLEMVNRGIQQLLGRASGPLHFRLLMMPTVVTILAIRAGLRDAREGEEGFLWAFLTDRAARPRLLRSALKDIGRVLIVALLMDTTYQIIVFKKFYVVQALIVVVMSAILPYVLFRGPIARLTRLLRKRVNKASSG